MTRGMAVACGAFMLVGEAVPTGIVAQHRAQDGVLKVRIADSVSHGAVRRAVLGAARRLERPACGLVLDDFRDRSHRVLSESLERLGMTASQYLTDALWFVEAGDTPQCGSDAVTAAFTANGSRVIHICGKRFAAHFERQAVQAEMLIIHELLHALGLGENPPSGREITRQVTKRCGGE